MPENFSLWTELRKRKVVRAAAIYAVVGWTSLEVTDTLAGILELERWVSQLVLGLIVLGFPFVLGAAWLYELTPRGIRREPLGRPGRGQAQLVLGAAAASTAWVLLVGLWWIWFGDREGRGPVEPTVAVLPLENRSSIDGQAYFVEGLHEELITELSKIEGLRVTSRTSVMEYREGGNIREIGQALGVATVVEGGVERVGDRVRVIVQLIDTQTDEHVFAETYDEVLTTERLFEIRSALTLRIADALHAALTPDEIRRIRSIPTDNLAAYELVLRGKELYEGGPEDVEKALAFFQEATRLEPEYAEGWAWLASAYLQRSQKGGYGPEMRDSARAHARHALRLDPEEAVAHRILGNFEQALELRPNWKVPLISLSARAWWRRNHIDGVRYAIRARQIAPTDPMVAEHFADHAHYLLLDDQVTRWMDEARRLDPDYYWIPVFESLYAIDRLDFPVAGEALSAVRKRDPGDPMVRWLEMRLGFAERDPDRVKNAAEALVKDHPDWDWFGQNVQARTLLGWALKERGQPREADRILSEAVQAGVGLLEGDTPSKPQLRYALAEATMLQGETDLALTRLTDAVEAGFPNLRFLRSDPIWEPVQDDPRFLQAVQIVADDLERQRTELEPVFRATG